MDGRSSHISMTSRWLRFEGECLLDEVLIFHFWDLDHASLSSAVRSSLSTLSVKYSLDYSSK